MTSTSLEIDPENEARNWACYNTLRLVAQTGAANGQAQPNFYSALTGVTEGIAMLLEQSPELKTQKDLRKAVDQIADQIKTFALGYRREFDKSGIHPMHQLDLRLDIGPVEIVEDDIPATQWGNA